MRNIGELNDPASAQLFGDFLLVQGIENNVEPQSSGLSEIWVKDDEQLVQATQLLGEFRANPRDPRFRKATTAAAAARQREQEEQKAYSKRIHSTESLFARKSAYGLGPLTLLLIVICSAIWMMAYFELSENIFYTLFISELEPPPGPWWTRLRGLKEIGDGQIWRLVTPALTHQMFFHFLFNMMWMRELGSMVEARSSSLYFFIMVVVFACFSNVGQYMTTGPNFLGMSGVVYGLFGYIWIRGKYESSSGYFIQQSTVIMMLIWFFLCFTPLFGMRIANTAHSVGLCLGMLWGYVDAKRRTT